MRTLHTTATNWLSMIPKVGKVVLEYPNFVDCLFVCLFLSQLWYPGSQALLLFQNGGRVEKPAPKILEENRGVFCSVEHGDSFCLKQGSLLQQKKPPNIAFYYVSYDNIILRVFWQPFPGFACSVRHFESREGPRDEIVAVVKL